MSLLHYFSNDANKRAKFIFNLIAPIYGLVDGALINSYQKSIDVVKREIGIEGKSVLDIGSGTGAWGAMFLSSNASKVHGIELSDKMLKESKKKHPQIEFNIGNAEDLKGIEDNSFDIVTASFVIHGVKSDRREKMLLEMKRVTRKHIVIHDFIGKTPLPVRFLEFMEKSDYKNFKINFCSELKAIFPETKKMQSDFGSGLYFATKSN